MGIGARIVGLLILVVCGPVLAGGPLQDDLWAQPKGAVAWWVFDPGPIGAAAATDPTRALAEAGLRALLKHALPIDSPPPISLSTFLTPGVLGSSPYRLCLIEIQAQPVSGRPGPDVAADLVRFAAVLEVRTRAGHERLIESIRASLDAATTEEPLDLPDGLKGVAASRRLDGAAAEVSWCSTTQTLLIGFGRGALAQWLKAEPGDQNAEYGVARSQVAGRRGATSPVLEAYVDLNALRTAAPEQFAFGRIGRLADAWRLANARVVLVSARLQRQADADRPRLLMLDAAFSSRAERPGTVHSMPITDGSWPVDWNDPVAPAPYAAIIRADWPNWVSSAIDTWAACSPQSGTRVDAARDQWLRRHGRTLDRLAAQAGTWIVIRGGATGESLHAQFTPSPRSERVQADLKELFGDLGDHVRMRSGVWSLDLNDDQADADRMLRRFFWGLSRSGAAVVGGWSDAPVEAAVTGQPAP